MASHQQSRIQFYLEKNKIGPLFEEMMTKLITETPDHPIPFLISHLQTKHSGSCKLHRTLSGSAALWAETGPAETKGTRRDYRSYEKPWQMHPKKPKKSKSDLAVSNISPPSPESKSLPRSIEHTSWEWRGHPENRDFDELNHILQESRKLGKALENLSRSIAVSDEIDQDPGAYSSSLMRPRVVGEWVGREEEDADPLAAEMLQPPVPRTKTEGWDCEESSPARRLKVELRTKGLKQQQQHHKKLLAAMLSQDSFDSTSGSATSIAEEDIDDEDDAMELLEDLDDLRMEGVTGLAPSGSKFSQGRSFYCPEPQAKVTLNICSRCARLQGDSLTDAREDDLQHPSIPEKCVPETPCPLTAAGAVTEDEGEFETAPGTRQPVWESDLKPTRGGSSLCQTELQLKEVLFTKELQAADRHREKDSAKLSEGKVVRSPNSPHSGLLSNPLLHSAPVHPPGGPPAKSAKPTSPAPGRALTPSSPVSRSLPSNTAGGSRARATSRPHTPSSLTPRTLTPGGHGAQRSRPATPLLTPPGPSSSETLGKATVPRGSLSEDEFYQQLQAVRQPWPVPSDTDSDCMEPPQKDKSRQSGARDASKRPVFSGL
ncbi:uncharacterized protein C8orf34 homolog [Scleropages formosus]|uniref:uncharacterized protein C8orf34 homolog n=1 Tax=Scleropages formosus TaxID=113540 RepID=UPI0010FA6E21|nr:uncharacterized protein C8orf34 homolog [Scleropages formosus]